MVDTFNMNVINRLVRQANDMGKDGIRVLGVQFLGWVTTQSEPSMIWICDRGPTSATEIWEQR